MCALRVFNFPHDPIYLCFWQPFAATRADIKHVEVGGGIRQGRFKARLPVVRKLRVIFQDKKVRVWQKLQGHPQIVMS